MEQTKEKPAGTMIGYCLKCKEKKEMQNLEPYTMKNGRQASKGTCTNCGGKIFKILGKQE